MLQNWWPAENLREPTLGELVRLVDLTSADVERCGRAGNAARVPTRFCDLEQGILSPKHLGAPIGNHRRPAHLGFSHDPSPARAFTPRSPSERPSRPIWRRCPTSSGTATRSPRPTRDGARLFVAPRNSVPGCSRDAFDRTACLAPSLNPLGPTTHSPPIGDFLARDELRRIPFPLMVLRPMSSHGNSSA